MSSLRAPTVVVLFASLGIVALSGLFEPRAEANTDPSCIAKEAAAGPCKTKPFGPTYFAPGCTTKKDQRNNQPKPGYIGAPCKENDGTAFSVGGKCVPGGKCKCDSCKADGDKGGMMPMLPMPPMMMPMMMMPMMGGMPQPCTPGTQGGSYSWVNTGTTTATSTPHSDAQSKEGCPTSNVSGVLESFGTGSFFQSTANSALNALGNVANTVGSSVINTAANAIETLTGYSVNTDFTQTGPTTVVVSPVGSNSADTTYAQAAYSSTSTTPRPAPLPQYTYDADTTQYGAFSGTPDDPSLLEEWNAALSQLLQQLANALTNLLNIF